MGLAFDLNFSKNGYFYTNYVVDAPLRTIIDRWSVLPDNPDEADINSQKILMEIPRINESHAGGQLAFGPDGYLYIGLGDGSPYGDLSGNAQNRSSLQGKILRIDVNKPSQGKNYGIPADNPFKGNTAGYKEEIYAYGFRNPWRFSFDSATDKLWVADVGQDRMEEIDVVEKGKNYGWSLMEGTCLMLVVTKLSWSFRFGRMAVTKAMPQSVASCTMELNLKNWLIIIFMGITCQVEFGQ